MERPRLLRITTVPISLHLLLRGQFRFMLQEGFEVYTVSAEGKEIPEVLKEGVPHIIIPLTRKITPIQDLISLWRLVQLIREIRPDIVHTHTPKAGLIGMMAAWWCRVPARMHTVAGLPVMEAGGLKRMVLSLTEKLTYFCAHKVYPNSLGLQTFMLDTLKVSDKKLKIIGKGSTNGIDVSFFAPSEELRGESASIRYKREIPEQAIVFSFVGRIVKDKGIRELIVAFRKLLDTGVNVYLLLIGPFEQELDPLEEEDFRFLHEHPHVVLSGFQNDVRPWILASDVFVFPSYREGFPNVVMQACCLEVPCIVSDINGCNEIIAHERTGIIVKPKDAGALYEAMKELAFDPDKRKRLGAEGRKFVAENFDQRYVWGELLKEYKSFF